MQQDWWKSSNCRWPIVVRHLWKNPRKHRGVRSDHAQNWICWQFKQAKIWISYRHNHKRQREQSACTGRLWWFTIFSSQLYRRIWPWQLDLEASRSKYCNKKKLFWCSCADTRSYLPWLTTTTTTATATATIANHQLSWSLPNDHIICNISYLFSPLFPHCQALLQLFTSLFEKENYIQHLIWQNLRFSSAWLD